MMRKTKLIFALAGLLFAATSCTKETPQPGPTPSSDDVVVQFSTGSATASTRAATQANPLKVGTVVKLLIYPHNGAMDLTVEPLKTALGTITADAGSGNLSAVVISSVNGVALTGAEQLTVKAGKSYDFVIVVNSPKADPLKPSVGAVTSGTMTGIPHGVDVMAGRISAFAAYGTPLNVKFTGTGANNDADQYGNLPHMCSGIAIQGSATQSLIDFVHNGNAVANPLKMSVVGADFVQCLPASANLPFGGSPIALAVQGNGNRTSYSMQAASAPKVITLPADTVYSDAGVVLPFPSATDHNTLNINFQLGVNGADVALEATGVQVPVFEAGYRYKFIVELDKNIDGNLINLYVVITKWDSLNWNTGMGGNGTAQEVMLKIGSWTGVTWGTAMGGNGTGSMQILSVRGWSALTWASIMGANPPVTVP